MYRPPLGEDSVGISAASVAEWLVDTAPAYINLINDGYDNVDFVETFDDGGQGQRVRPFGIMVSCWVGQRNPRCCWNLSLRDMQPHHVRAASGEHSVSVAMTFMWQTDHMRRSFVWQLVFNDILCSQSGPLCRALGVGTTPTL